MSEQENSIERDVMAYDFAIVGGGPAGLACAIRLKEKSPEATICVLEKGAEIGAHILSGCVMEPGPLDELLPGWRDNPPAICVPAGRDEFRLFTRARSFRLPTPPQMHNAGNFIVSLGELCKQLAAHAESLDIEVFPGFPGRQLLIEGDGADARVIGVRCGDMGMVADDTPDGQPGPNFAPGVDIHAQVTILAEGCRGSLSKQAIARFQLDHDAAPQTYGLGFKELWQLPAGRTTPGLIQHTVGWPLDNSTYGGSFIYHLDDDRLYIGYVVGLDYTDPRFSPFEAFQQFKHHPDILKLLEGGEIISSGARTIIEGGLQALPKMEMPGALLIGDAAGTLNVPKIKGVHQALRSGMLAAEHLADTGSPAGYDAAFRASPAGLELRQVRNIRPGFHRGLWLGIANAALETVFGGRSPWTLKTHADWESLELRASANADGEQAAMAANWHAERTLPPRDRLASVYFANTVHEEAQPVHLRVADTSICATRCAEEYGNPCTRFCPVGVYEMVADDHGGRRLQINASNCVHCKACDIKDPYQIIEWVTPEGGSGPNYQTL
ncbi:MAG: 4Fe-4S dicluster domain-containing protein [Gammaproteobacteria bacterium]